MPISLTEACFSTNVGQTEISFVAMRESSKGGTRRDASSTTIGAGGRTWQQFRSNRETSIVSAQRADENCSIAALGHSRAGGNLDRASWIPACAGMTDGWHRFELP